MKKLFFALVLSLPLLPAVARAACQLGTWAVARPGSSPTNAPKSISHSSLFVFIARTENGTAKVGPPPTRRNGIKMYHRRLLPPTKKPGCPQEGSRAGRFYLLPLRPATGSVTPTSTPSSPSSCSQPAAG